MEPVIARRTVFGVAGIAALALAGCTTDGVPGQKPSTVAAPKPSAGTAPTASHPPSNSSFLLATLAHTDKIARIDPENQDKDAVEFLTVGAAPWGIGVYSPTHAAYVATAEGLAVVDLATFKREALVPYLHPAPEISQGEYRPGGLGLAVAPDGSAVYVAVSVDTQTCFLEVFDVQRGVFTGSVRVGWRPFDVVVAPDGAWVATIDHDSFTVTVVDPASLHATTRKIAPFGTEGGLASWEKIHYAAVDADGTILLPVQGKVVVRLDPVTGKSSTIPSAANSHAHGTALARRLLLTVGTGSFGNADGVPNLSVLNLDTGDERIAPLDVPHETVMVWSDAAGADWAVVAGGNTRDEGWDGITFVRLSDFEQRKLNVPGYPQVVVAYQGTGRGAA
ncbi:hypothetical protein AS189_17375 [Arthrobacter alpinus]|uniref:40-residue YVTN family beta-propeller repeat-containing protein n=1 Tax=Arthrobacter alpinus TaxID=656366 RepID=A0A0S2M280_9MICC|nr:hypothetical protein [Arthrobacter alpinus]ALO67930.1 hypothetical protein AS189_17375 [Arthrobacter alpinus]